jgi:hypothetical protein
MTRALITIHSQADRERAAKWSMQAPVGLRIEFKQAKRSDDQNSKLWAMLTEVATQCPWHGVKLTPDDYKFIFMDALKRELRMVPNIDNTGFVNLGRSSSDLSKSEMSDLIELIIMFGAQHDVKFKDDNTNSNSSGVPQGQTDTPAATDPHEAAGTPSPELSADSSPADDGEARDGVPGGDAVSQPTLPQGWEIRLREALGRARNRDGLVGCARGCFEKLGAFPSTPGDVETAKAIRAAFEKNFGEANKEARENLLRELV